MSSEDVTVGGVARGAEDTSAGDWSHPSPLRFFVGAEGRPSCCCWRLFRDDGFVTYCDSSCGSGLLGRHDA